MLFCPPECRGTLHSPLTLQLGWGYVIEFWHIGMCRCHSPDILSSLFLFFLSLSRLKAENPVEDAGKSWGMAEPPDGRYTDL